MAMPSPVRVLVTEKPIPEVRTIPEVQNHVQRIYEKGLPGFIIRSSGLVDLGTNSQEQIADALLEILSERHPEDDHAPYEHLGSSTIHHELVSRGIAHHDYSRVDNSFSQLRIHRTVNGAGKVTLANSGIIDQATGSSAGSARLMGDPAVLISGIDDLVNPDTVNPNVYIGYLGTGDTLIFPTAIAPNETHEKAGPVWHQFDIDVVPRHVKLLVLGQV